MIISPLTESRIHQRSNHGTTSGCRANSFDDTLQSELIPDPMVCNTLRYAQCHWIWDQIRWLGFYRSRTDSSW
jgi:hypothetical protein